jgi:hypothetical protein
MRSALKFFLLECIAAATTMVQMHNLVRTDEAKYLLNIPYPHPPLARGIISAFDGFPWQEVLWRFLLASFLLQLVWIVWSMGMHLPKRQRATLCGLWLLSSAVLFQAGTVMIAPITAMEYMLFLWIYVRKERDHTPYAGLLGLLWLASIFTAFQAVLLLPVVCMVFYRLRLPLSTRALYCFMPMLLLGLYVLSNPFTLASMALQAAKDSGNTISFRMVDTLKVWALGGGIALSALGTWGLVRSRDWPLLMSFGLLTAYVFLGRYDYYAILFTPLLITGAADVLKRDAIPPLLSLGTTAVGTAVLVFVLPPIVTPSSARGIVLRLQEEGVRGNLLIAGSFGHEWQYESPFPIRRYRSEFLESAGGLICLDPCPEVQNAEGWEQLEGSPVETWVKKMP